MAEQWEMVDEGWGRHAVEFATLSEPANVREYVTVHHEVDVRTGDRLLDVACGSGLAVELAGLRGAACAGIDASARLVAVARDRSPDADIRVGDMLALPWEDESFDVVTSFRGIWGTTPDALAEVRRVLRPGGRLGLTVWGHIKASDGAWALRPFTLARPAKVEHQADMVRLGRPGAGELLLGEYGFVDVRRVRVPFVWEFPDPATYARILATTGPAYEAIQDVGEDEFLRFAEETARERLREGLPLRAQIDVVGYVARTPATGTGAGARPATAGSASSFLPEPPTTRDIEAMFDTDVEEMGFVMNVSRLWAHLPDAHRQTFALLGTAARAAGLTFRDRGILVAACASTLGDSYCSLAWGHKLAAEAGEDLAAGVLRGDDGLLDARERALAAWARTVVRDPNGTTAPDVAALRGAGLDDGQVFAVTLFVAGRLLFSTVNDALGSRPDAELARSVARPVRDAVTFGRPVAAG